MAKFGLFTGSGQTPMQQFEGDALEQEGDVVKVMKWGKDKTEPLKRQVASVHLDKNQTVREI